MMHELITIGITAYREGDYLRECWESVLAQTDDRWEAVMVLDGGSDKRTKRIFDSLSHPKLRKFELSENSGPYPARTKAIQEAHTDWYAHLDADDRLSKDTVQTVLRTIERNPDVDYVFGDCLYFNKETEYVRSVDQKSHELVEGTGVLCATAPIRVSLFDRVGGFAPQLFRGGADWDFWVGVAEINAKGANAGGVIYKRRLRPNSVGSGWSMQRDRVVKIIIDRHLNFFCLEERKRHALGKAYELIARQYRTMGHREKAAEYARAANKHGFSTSTLDAILLEARMPRWRYLLRRFGRGAAHVCGRLVSDSLRDDNSPRCC